MADRVEDISNNSSLDFHQRQLRDAEVARLVFADSLREEVVVLAAVLGDFIGNPSQMCDRKPDTERQISQGQDRVHASLSIESQGTLRLFLCGDEQAQQCASQVGDVRVGLRFEIVWR